MQRFKQSLVAFAGVVFIVVVAALIVPSLTQGQADPVGPSRPVQVVNLPADPVPVAGQVTVAGSVDVNASPITPVNLSKNFDIDDDTSGESSTLYTVPDGKRLVVTHVTAELRMPPGQRGLCDIRVADLPAIGASYDLLMSPAGSLFGWDIFISNEGMNLYVPAGHEVEVGCRRPAITGMALIRFNLAGYLVDAPAVTQ